MNGRRGTDRWKRLYLVGFMAVGKTTIGRQLARQLGWTFVDLDREIALAEELSIPEIFSRDGEARFRELEARHLRETFAMQNVVVATGGGVYTRQSTVDDLRDHGVALWLDLPVEEILPRLRRSAQERPLAGAENEIRRLYAERAPFYRQADFRIPLKPSDSVGATARRIVAEVVRTSREAPPSSAEKRGTQDTDP